MSLNWTQVTLRDYRGYFIMSLMSYFERILPIKLLKALALREILVWLYDSHVSIHILGDVKIVASVVQANLDD